ncbi:unnamed protein product [Rotaria socialis]|uniref:Protein kinase domain-containing protein n=1 Tax=Rotaria socialis TaxID=392032 RepID=A0A817XF99_9BILA|nr:unnamed protein product [Rotaria socialis]CAF4858555.1 unnamed protein product [Rotaria socialis]
MADKQNVKESEVDKNLALQRILLEQEKERTKQAKQRAKEKLAEQRAKEKLAEQRIKEKERTQREREKERTKQAEQLARIEVARTEQLRLEKQKRDDENKERSKLMKTIDGQFISISTSALKLLIDESGYYDKFVAPYLYPIDIVPLLNDNNINVTNDMINIFAKHFNPLKSCGKIVEDTVQFVFDQAIEELFTTFKMYTSLNYLSTRRKFYLNGLAPGCTFIYKSIKIDQNDEHEALQDFAVCLGELKSTLKESLEDKSWIGQLMRYLDLLLEIQNREKVYGFLTNVQYIRFYCVEKNQNSPFNNYYHSKDFNMFFMPSASSSRADTLQLNKNAKQRVFNIDTMELFIKFLTMNASFYEYRTLNIDPDESLLSDTFYIKTRLGNGATSMVYELVRNDYNQSPDYSKLRAIKISKAPEHEPCFKNEVKILKQLESSDNFKLFYENVLNSSPTGKFIIFENLLFELQSLTLIQSKQFIDIIESLYNCRIIHRDIRPQNLMLDKKCERLKLIDFGYAATFEINQETKQLPIEGVISYAGLKFFSTLLLNPVMVCCYEYERTFDLPCAINLIMYMTDNDVKEKLRSFKDLQSIQERMGAAYSYWLDRKNKNKNYADLLNLIDNSQGSPDFGLIKNEIETYFNMLH